MDREGVHASELARRLSVDRAAVCRWLQGQATPRQPIDNLAAALGLSVVEFFAAPLPKGRR